MYRTGDLARALPDGSIEFCGRIDHQVKIHGYRVELGEIESALREHTGVREAAVLVRQHASGDTQLLAWVSGDATPAALREHLKERLPQYMVPSALVPLEKLPLTANGKIDRQALAALPIEIAASARATSPRTPTEETLTAIWRELLSVESVGIEDDVFDLGAHSLMAMKALTRIRDAFDVNLALRNLFEHPTIAGFAAIIEGLLSAKATPVRDGGEREEVVL
jgi:acyl carrier protein